MKKNRKLVAVIVVLAGLAVSLTGCGMTSDNTNIKAGMDAVKSGDYQKALTCFEAAGEKGEDSRLLYRGKGLAYMGLTMYDEAAENLEACLQQSLGVVEPMDYDVNYYLATAYLKKGDAGKAEKTYTAILNLKPEAEDALFLRGYVRLEMGNYDDAVADFNQLIEIAPKDYGRLIDIYEALYAHGYKQIGQEYLQTAMADAKDSMSMYEKGRMYYYLEDYKQASNFLEQAKDTGDAEAYLYLGRAYEATGDYNYAASVYNSYLNHDSSHAGIYNQLGLCEMKREDYQAALNAFQAAIQIEKNGMMQTLQFNEIVAYEYLQEYRKAAALMESYIRAYPDDQAAAREYEFLKTR